MNDQAGVTPSFVISALEYPIVITVLFLACWADPKPRDIALEGKRHSNKSPIKYSDVFPQTKWMI